MAPKAFSYFKAFGLFLLIVAAVTFIIVFAKQYLRQSDISSTLSEILDFILSVIMWFGYFSAWMLLRRRLKAIEKR